MADTRHSIILFQEKHFCPTVYLETTSTILSLLSGLFSTNTFENNVPICFLVVVVVVVLVKKRKSLFLSFLLATDLLRK